MNQHNMIIPKLLIPIILIYFTSGALPDQKFAFLIGDNDRKVPISIQAVNWQLYPGKLLAQFVDVAVALKGRVRQRGTAEERSVGGERLGEQQLGFLRFLRFM